MDDVKKAADEHPDSEPDAALDQLGVSGLTVSDVSAGSVGYSVSRCDTFR
jgi:hypothetical protein